MGCIESVPRPKQWIVVGHKGSGKSELVLTRLGGAMSMGTGVRIENFIGARWTQVYTEDGAPYYWNQSTGATSWRAGEALGARQNLNVLAWAPPLGKASKANVDLVCSEIYSADADAVLFVVDAGASDLHEAAGASLRALVADERLQNAAFAVLLNKQDLPNTSPVEVALALGVTALELAPTQRLEVFPTSFTSEDWESNSRYGFRRVEAWLCAVNRPRKTREWPRTI